MRTLKFALVALTLAAPVTLNAQDDPPIVSREEQLAGTKQVFAMFDQNGDGFLIYNEIERLLLQAISTDEPPAEPSATDRAAAKRMFKSLDANADQKVTLTELSDWMLRVFDCIDKNRDGGVSQGESNRNEKRCQAAQLQ